MFVGHSLGANISASIARKHDKEAHVYNLGSSIGNVRRGLFDRLKKPKKRNNFITHYKSKDIISDGAIIMGKQDKVVKVKCKEKKALNCHSLDNFLM